MIIITGAGSGLGRSYAEYFANKGAKLILNNHLRVGVNPENHPLSQLKLKLQAINKNIILD